MTTGARRQHCSITGVVSTSGCDLKGVSKVILAVVYSLFVVVFPWEYLLGFTFPDKLNYIDRFVQLQLVGPDSINPLGGILGAFISESLWGLILYWLGSLGFNADQALLCISFLCLLSIVIYVFGKLHPAIGGAFLLNPLIVDFVMAQQRSALAFAGFLIFVSAKSNFLRVLVALACVFVHISFVLLLAGFYISILLARLKITNLSLFNRAFHLVIAFAVAFVVLAGKDIVLGALGDRRAGVYEGSQSLMYASFWLGLVVYIVIFSRSRLDWTLEFALLFVGFFLVAVALNTYSSRFLAFAFPFMIIVLARSTFNEAFFGYYLLFCYQSIQWVYWWGWFTR